jgi:hypothetical protein
MMNTPFEYRSYMIASEDGWFIAKSIDGEPGEIGSRHLLQLMRAIDALWAALDTGAVPQWFSTEEMIILDQPVRDHLKLRAAFKIFPVRPAAAFETTPSEVDPPASKMRVLFTILAAVGIATPLAIGMHQLIESSEPAIIFTLAVMAIALRYGSWAGIAVSLIAMALYNLVILPPVTSFTIPGAEELLYTLINTCISFALPWTFTPRQRPVRAASESDHIRDTA